MDYFLLKTIHIISASVLFGGGISLFMYQLFINQHEQHKRQLKTSRKLLGIQLLVLIPCGMIQLVTGFMIINIKHYNLHQLWILGTVIGFIFSMGTYLVSIYYYKLIIDELITENNNTHVYHKRYKQFGLITFGILCMMIFLMSNGPKGLNL